MNRAQRRRLQARDSLSAKNIRKLQDRVEATGVSSRIHGLTDACIDCHATGELVLLPGHLVIGEVFHDDGCPAAIGITAWQPVPSTERSTKA